MVEVDLRLKRQTLSLIHMASAKLQRSFRIPATVHHYNNHCIGGNPPANHGSTSNPPIFLPTCLQFEGCCAESGRAHDTFPGTCLPGGAAGACRAPVELRGSVCQKRTPINRCFSQHDTRFSSTPDKSVYIRLEPPHHL